MSSISAPVDLLRDFKFSILQFAQDRAIFSIGAILVLVVFYAVRYLASPYRKLPPGSRGYSIIGNLLEPEGSTMAQVHRVAKEIRSVCVSIFPWSISESDPTR